MLTSPNVFSQDIAVAPGPGGLYKTAQGTLNLLYIFAQFADDTYDSTSSEWPMDQQPTFMNGMLDETWSGNPTPGSATDYFAQMSRNKLRIIGKEVFVITPNTRQWYLKKRKRRYDIHKEILQELDKTWDFAEFDNWTYIKKYTHVDSADGIVDMIVFIWRNIADDLPDSKKVKTTLDFNQSQADLGKRKPIFVDDSLRQIRTYWGNHNSGVTVLISAKKKSAYYGSIHEFAHFLLGNNSMHSGFAFWGMVNRWGVRCQVANAFERHRLNWLNVTDVRHETQTLYDLTLSDFVTTGEAFRIEIDSAKNEYFYLENHQALSEWDRPDINGATGLYIIHQHGKKALDLELLPADGRFKWSIAGFIKNPSGTSPTPELPVWEKGIEDPVNGWNDCEKLPYVYKNKDHYVQIGFYKNESGDTVHKPLYQGDGHDQFDMRRNVFSPWSNMNSQDAEKKSSGIAVEITNISKGIITFNLHINTAEQASPSIPQNFVGRLDNNYPQISWNANREPDVLHYEIWKKQDGNWFLLDTTRVTSFTDHTETDIADTALQRNFLEYKIRVIDTQKKVSSFTDPRKL